MNDVWVGGLIGVGGVVVGAAVTWAQAAYERSKQRKSDAQYLAIRVVCILDKFLEDCAATVADAGEVDGNGINQAKVRAPDAPVYPDNVDWRSIDSALMYSLLSFQNEVRAAEEAVSASWEWADPPDFDGYFEERAEQYGRCGLKAAKLCQELRREYAIPPNKYPDYWNPVDVIKKEQAALVVRQREREVEMAKLMAHAPPPPVPAAPGGEVSPGEGETR